MKKPIDSIEARHLARASKRIYVSGEGKGTIVGTRGQEFVVDLDAGGTTQIHFTSVGRKKGLGHYTSWILENSNSSIQAQQLLESKIRKIVKEELIKEDGLSRQETSMLQSISGLTNALTKHLENFIRNQGDEEALADIWDRTIEYLQKYRKLIGYGK